MDKYIVERRARERLAWFKRVEEIGDIDRVCAELGVSRRIFYKWYTYYAKEGLSGLKTVPRVPGATLRPCLRIIQELILRLRRETSYGPYRLAFYLKRDYGIKLSVYGYKVLVRAGEMPGSLPQKSRC